MKLAKLYALAKDSRTDFLHKLTTRLVRENQALAIEDLNVSGMVRELAEELFLPPISREKPQAITSNL